MPEKRITMQDIADACGLSRNTVSKVFNGRGAVPEATRHEVLKKAQELNYRQIPGGSNQPKPPVSRSIAIFTMAMPSSSHYGSLFISSFANQLTRVGYNILMYEITREDVQNKRLPTGFVLEQAAGILGIELFDRTYSDFVCSLGLPAIFADTYALADFSIMGADVISMENSTSIIRMVDTLISTGITKFGFVGDYTHCNSFYERWNGFRNALDRAELPLYRDRCILADDHEPYDDIDWILAQLNLMPDLPEAFLCANDYLAIRLMRALKKKGLAIPEDIMVVGFDNSPES